MGTRLIIIGGVAGRVLHCTSHPGAKRLQVEKPERWIQDLPCSKGEDHGRVRHDQAVAERVKCFFYLDSRSSLIVTRLSLSGQDTSTVSPCHHGIAPPNWKHCSDGKRL